MTHRPFSPPRLAVVLRLAALRLARVLPSSHPSRRFYGGPVRGSLRGSLLALSLFLIAACTSDTYDKGDGRYSYLRADMAELFTDGTGRICRVVTDEGDTLSIPSFSVEAMSRPDTLYRAILYYNISTDGMEPVSVGRISTLVPHAIDSVLTDPVNLESLWLSTTRRYVNAGLYLMLGATDDESVHQTIGIAADTVVTYDDGTRTLYARLYHDQGDVPQYYSQRVYVSIPTDSIDADTLRLRINTYSGEYENVFDLTAPAPSR